MAGGADRPAADRGDPPYDARARDSLSPVARNRIRFIEIAIRFRQNGRIFPAQETAPSGWIDGYLRRNL